MLNNELFTNNAYICPSWLVEHVDSAKIPQTKLELGRFPTPYHKFHIPDEFSNGLDIWVKRDDLSSFDLGGNKVRKLQFLLADALSKKADTVVTIGAAQSNHCRATAVASRQLGLDPYLILRTRGEIDNNIHSSLIGNLLFDKMVGAQIKLVTTEEYSDIGQEKLLDILCKQLENEGRIPYSIPVGGSNIIGVWGYIDAIEEIRKQQIKSGLIFDHIVFSCGSGGTASGLSLGAKLCGINSVHGICVCDTPEIFYDHINETITELGIDISNPGTGTGKSIGLGKAEEWLSLYDGSGIGYGKSTTEELDFIVKVSRKSGISLDPVYSGKGLYYFLNDVIHRNENKNKFKKNDKILFIHTGGGFGLYDKVEELSLSMNKIDISQTTKLELPESISLDEKLSSNKAGSMKI